MSTWTAEELTRIERAEELQVAPLHGDGTPRRPVPVWVVRDGDDLYLRSYRGVAGAWYRAARASGRGHISGTGIDKDVSFVEAADPQVNDHIDAAYRAKYGRYGAMYITPMVGARQTTLKLVPR